MIRVSFLYPSEAEGSFDHDYFLRTHLPLVAARLGSALVGYEVDRGIAGGDAGAPPPFEAAVHMTFRSVDDFQRAFEPHADELVGDIPNYTDINATMQISEVRG